MEVDILELRKLARDMEVNDKELLACAIEQYGILCLKMDFGVIKFKAEFK
jgi:hypothetical protein